MTALGKRKYNLNSLVLFALPCLNKLFYLINKNSEGGKTKTLLQEGIK